MNTSELVKQFVSIALEQDRAILMDESTRYNKLYSQMDLVKQELKRREGDERRALHPLLAHANPQVRLKAAIALLVLEADEARKALQKLWDAKEFPQAGDAIGILRALDDGSYVPS